ncbi:MAG: threonylcarbamoyl-AMP synthase [Bacteroidetes bacterium]|nr:threonylcarbamoyl-AMP synthase [Bacteroidota bacterium]MCH8170428.1 threonylcarbamoyl-AMP synthase [Bacteroidota bacterium]MCH8941328.1 threonylcarbamoyl-AMP synthase [Bacteroidota bacterium]
MIEISNALKINVDENLKKSVALAKKLYLEGSIFIYPTDTIYGIGANPFNEKAIKKIDDIKGRNEDKKNILLINNIENLLEYVDIPSEKYLDFLLAVWPNPVSVVLSLNKKFKKILNTSNVAFRIPNHRFCLKLLDELKMPLISTSVNRSNNPPINEPSLIFEEFSNIIDNIFYSTKKNFHIASTLIDLTGTKPKILRQGKINVDGMIDKYLF